MFLKLYFENSISSTELTMQAFASHMLTTALDMGLSSSA